MSDIAKKGSLSSLGIKKSSSGGFAALRKEAARKTGVAVRGGVREALVLVIDRSGSMGCFEPSGMIRIQAAADAAKRLTEACPKGQTKAGVVTFDDSAYVQAGISGNLVMVAQRISEITPRGGTVLSSGLGLGFTMLENEAAQESALEVKRMIVLSDGESWDEEDCYAISNRCKEHEIIVDTVAFGEDGDSWDLLRQISKITGGRFFLAKNAAELRSTFLKLEASARGLLGPAR